MRTATPRPAPANWGRPLFIACLLIAFTTPPVAAQGKGKKNGQRASSSPATTGSAAPLASSATPSTLQFGTWLDDASLVVPGGAWTAVSFGYFRLADIRQTDFPIVDAGVGLTNRVQFGVTVPYYRIHLPGGTGFGGVGDVYVNSKVSVIDPSANARGFGLALTPLVEILELPDAEGDKVSWGLPVDFEFKAAGHRFYGSTGFFSRGAVFGGGAIEMPVNDRLVVTGALTLMRSLKQDPAAQAIGIPRDRADVTAMASYLVSSAFAAFVGTGRTLGSNPSATSFMFNAGVSVSMAPRISP